MQLCILEKYTSDFIDFVEMRHCSSYFIKLIMWPFIIRIIKITRICKDVIKVLKKKITPNI